MTEQVVPEQSPPPFDYMLYEGDPEHLRTVVATPSDPSPRIDPSSLKLKHRIGHGAFGDVWLATHHQSADDYNEYHEVAVKMLHPIKQDYMPKILDKFEEIFLKLRKLQSVCWLHGVTVISGKMCIVMKFYEGSVGDRMAKLKGGKLPLPDVMRYGMGLAKGIQEVHSLSMLMLNVKPTNLLLNEHEQVVLGDFGIPFLLLGVELPDPNMALRLGTPNYMAPEQWEPEVRGPISLETDVWGFGCCMVEMLTGVQPWFGSSIDEIYKSVVVRQDKPQVPSGLPPVVQNVLNGCFEYDLRNRPLIDDILHAFERAHDAVGNDGEWIGLGSDVKILLEKTQETGYSTWFLSKDRLQVGDTVRSRKTSSCCKPQNMSVAQGTVVGFEEDGLALVQVQQVCNPLRVNTTTLERVTSGLAAGDWVRLTDKKMNHSTIGVLHSVNRDGCVSVGFVGRETLWTGHSSQVQNVDPFYVGQFVRLKKNVFTPRFPWLCKHERATGRVLKILPNGCLVVRFPGRFVLKNDSILADPAEVDHVSFDECPGWVDKYKHVEDYHWAVRPLTIVLSIAMAMKIGSFVGHSVRGGRRKDGEDGGEDGRKSRWLPPPVANILSGEAALTAR